MEQIAFMGHIALSVVIGIILIIALIVWGNHNAKVCRKHDLEFHRKYADLIGIRGFIDRDSKIFTVLDRDLTEDQRHRLFKLIVPVFGGNVPKQIPCKIVDVHRSDCVNGFMEVEIEPKEYEFCVVQVNTLFIRFRSSEIGEFNAHREDFPYLSIGDKISFKLRVRKSYNIFFFRYDFSVDA